MRSIRSEVIRGLESVYAPWDDAVVSRIETKVRARNADKVLPFAFVAGRNAGIDILAKRATEMRRAEAARIASDAAIAAASRRSEAVRELERLITAARLTHPECGVNLDALEAFEVHGFSTRQVCDLFGIKRDNAYKRRSRGAALVANQASPLLHAEILQLRPRK